MGKDDTSGASATNSAACLRMVAASAVAQRVSMRRRCPTPIAVVLAGTPRRGAENRDRPQSRAEARRSAVLSERLCQCRHHAGDGRRRHHLYDRRDGFRHRSATMRVSASSMSSGAGQSGHFAAQFSRLLYAQKQISAEYIRIRPTVACCPLPVIDLSKDPNQPL